MNTQERQALQDFLDELSRAQVKNKDREAEALIMQAVQRQPDAPYLLVQRVLLQEQALNAAQEQIRSLQQQLHGGRQASPDRFLGSEAYWGRSGAAAAGGEAYGLRMDERFHSAPAMRPGLMNSGMGSFLGSMAGVAAGVAAGSFLYHGIDHLLHHRDNEEDPQQQGLTEMSGDENAADSFLNEDTSGGQDFSQDVGGEDPGI